MPHCRRTTLLSSAVVVAALSALLFHSFVRLRPLLGARIACGAIAASATAAPEVAMIHPADCTSCLPARRGIIERHVSSPHELAILLDRKPTEFQRRQLALAHVRPSGVVTRALAILTPHDTVIACTRPSQRSLRRTPE